MFGQVLRRIKALLPTVRLIVMLRNPTERAYSHYSMTAEKAADTPKVLADRRCVACLSAWPLSLQFFLIRLCFCVSLDCFCRPPLQESGRGQVVRRADRA